MNLSKRLMKAVELVTDGNAVCDVGCDHAYTSIELVNTKAPYAVASDVRKGPLKAAGRHVEEADLSDRIAVVLADGVPKDICALLPDGVPASLVITGLGGMLMISILTEAGELLMRFDELILSPQSDLYKVRLFLVENGYDFVDEAEVLEDGKFYTLMKVVRGRSRSLAEAELLYGPCLLAKKDLTLFQYLGKRLKVLEGIIKALAASGRTQGDARLCEIEEELNTIYEAAKYYESAE